MSRDALADHHGVIHHDADQDEEREHRTYIEGKVRRPEERQGADEGKGYAERDPERDAEIEHQEETAENQDDADQPVLDQGLVPVCGGLGPIIDDPDFRVFWGIVIGEPGSDGFRHFHDRLVLVPIHTNEDRRPTVEFRHDRLIHESVPYSRDFAKGDDRPVDRRDDRNILEFLTDSPFGDRVQDHIAVPRTQLAGR